MDNKDLTNSSPSRIVGVNNTFWLSEGREIMLVPGQLSARIKNGVCYLLLKNNKQSTLVNGETITNDHILQDEDFITCGKHRFFFQQNPLGSWAQYKYTQYKDSRESVDLPKKLQGFVIIREQDFSFDKGKHFYQWNQVARLSAQRNINDLSKRLVLIELQGGKTNTGEQTIQMTVSEGIQFFNWFRNVSPYNVSIEGEDAFRNAYPDPYTLMSARLIKRIQDGEVNIPGGEAFLRGAKVKSELLKDGLRWAGIGIIAIVGGIASMVYFYSDAYARETSSFLKSIQGPLIPAVIIALGCMGFFWGLQHFLRAITAPSG